MSDALVIHIGRTYNSYWTEQEAGMKRNNPHYKRYSKNAIKEALLDTPVVFIMGARQSGKTTLVKELTDGNWKFANLDNQAQLAAIEQDPVGFIKEHAGRSIAIDEIQRLPELLLVIKESVDEDRRPGRFLLTGSANALVLPRVLDSLAGRIETILLNPLSECEINNTKPSFLQTILQLKAPQVKNPTDKECLIRRVVSGCFPEPLQRKTEERTAAWYEQYTNSLVQKDMADLDAIDHPDKMLELLQLAAYYSGKLINFNELGAKLGLSAATTRKYLSLIEQLFLLRKLPAWHTNEYKRLVKTPKLHLTDTGLVCAIRDIDSRRLISDPTKLGPLLETFVINELKKQGVWLRKKISFYHYRDKDKVEVDCIIENADRDCFAIEVKASATIVNSDFKGLRRFKDIAKDRFKIGLLLYCGEQTLSFGDGLFAVPVSALWAELS
jgi:uncharacterized protein